MFHSAFDALIGTFRRTRPVRTRARRSRVLGLERLEPRENPATVTFIGPAGGLWSDPTNWDTGELPGPEDVAVSAIPIVLPAGFGACVSALSDTADLQVDGSLEMIWPSILFRQLNVGSSGTVNVDSTFLLFGGGRVRG